MCRIRLLGSVLLAAGLLTYFFGCGAPPPGSGDVGGGGSDGTGPAMFSLPPDPTSFREITTICEADDGTNEPCTWVIPTDQLVVMMDADLEFAQALAAAEDLVSALERNGITADIVGQIPALAIFQIQISNDETDADAAFTALEAARAVVEAGSHVFNVTYNYPMKPRTYTAMEPDDDNSRHIRSSYRSGLAAIDYYQAIPIFDEILGSRSGLTPVSIGIVDTGLAIHTGQFDDVELVFTTADVTDSIGHGTAIAALIAADNGDALVNGIASRVINGPTAPATSRLRIVFGKGDFESLSAHVGTLLETVRVVQEGVDIVNLSLGYGHHYRRARGLTTTEFRNARAQWESFFGGRIREVRDAADVLFVVAAPNESIPLSRSNDFPSGIGLNNVITVGGIDTESLYARDPQTAMGGALNIAAPSTNIPILRPREGRPVGSIDVSGGTSYAAAMITSMAAIMYSVNASATPSQIKSFFTSDDNTWAADPSAGGRRASLIRTVGRYMLRHGNLSRAQSVLDNLAGANGTPDPSGYLMNESISEPGTSVAVSGPLGSVNRTIHGAEFVRASAKFNNTGGILTGGTSTYSVQVGNFGFGAGQVGRFELNRPYMMGAGGFATLAIAPPGSMSAEYTGAAVDSGSLVYTACEITTRSLPLDLDTLGEAPVTGDDAFIFIQVEGSFEALIEGADLTVDPPDFPVFYNIAAEFDTIFILIDVDETTLDYLEESCIGGYQYGFDP